jgi:hypothetical protein
MCVRRDLIVTWNTGCQGDATPGLAFAALAGWGKGNDE